MHLLHSDKVTMREREVDGWSTGQLLFNPLTYLRIKLNFKHTRDSIT